MHFYRLTEAIVQCDLIRVCRKIQKSPEFQLLIVLECEVYTVVREKVSHNCGKIVVKKRSDDAKRRAGQKARELLPSAGLS